MSLSEIILTIKYVYEIQYVFFRRKLLIRLKNNIADIA